jgi:hypothetical protein
MSEGHFAVQASTDGDIIRNSVRHAVAVLHDAFHGAF